MFLCSGNASSQMITYGRSGCDVPIETRYNNSCDVHRCIITQITTHVMYIPGSGDGLGIDSETS